MNQILKEKLKNKKLSILGDSISTYENISNHPLYNPTLLYNPTYYTDQIELDETYWMILINTYQMELCVNNSWSGGYLSRHVPNVGSDFTGNLSCAIERANYLARNQQEKPDIILVYIGTNDLGAKIHPEVIKESYVEMLYNIRKNYPDAITFCIGLSRHLQHDDELTQIYNKIIQDTVLSMKNHFVYVDIYHNDSQKDDTFDGEHPTKEGMKKLAFAIEEKMVGYFSNKRGNQ